MSQEHQPEHRSGAEHSHAELEQAAQRRREHLRRHEQHHSPEHPDHRAEAAREIIGRQEKSPGPPASPHSEAEPMTPPAELLNPAVNYAHTLASLQRRLTPVSRGFSSFIHTPAVERISEGLEKTIARPSVAAGASWTALIVGGVFYLTARRYGYALSGSELVLSFAVGAVVGLVLELLRRKFVRRGPR